MKWWRKFVAWRHTRRGETIVKDNLLIIENGGKNSLEYRDRQKLVTAINQLLPEVWRARSSSTALTTATIRPVISIRRPRKWPFVSRAPGLVYARRASDEVEVAVLEFKYANLTIKCACTAEGKAYRYYRLYVGEGIKQEEFWLPIYDLQKSNISSAILREIKKRLERIVSPVS